MPQTTTRPFALLDQQQYANLFTFRKNGQAIKTPVWFAEQGDRLYIMTTMDSGKVKRIRNNRQVLIGPSDRAGNPKGPTIEAQARLLGPNEVAMASAALDRKYGLMKAVFDFFGTLRGMDRAWIEVSPATEPIDV